MEGDGGEAVEFDLPSVLAALDGRDPAEQYAAVRRVRAAIDGGGRVEACVPTVPKLRALLEREIDFRDEVAACLADLASEAPTDVAPSTATLVAVAAERVDAPATRELLRCLAAVAAERPEAVVDHTGAIADVLERRRGYDRWGLRALARVSRKRPDAIEPAAPVLADALAANPMDNGTPALRALGRLARSDAAVPSLEFVDHAVALVDHDDRTLRTDAIDCLGDVAQHDPAAVEPACEQLRSALASSDPDTRAVAAATIARVAAEAETAVEPVRDRLVALLGDDHAHVRANACMAIGNGRVDAVDDRLADLAREDSSPNVRDRAAWALAQLP
jgi:hypothetical protein